MYAVSMIGNNMKRIYVAALMALMTSASNSALAEWFRVSGNDKVTAYADTTSLRQKGNIVRMTSMFDFKVENLLVDGTSYQSVVRETEFNCRDHVQHMVGFSLYTGNMGKGRVLDKGGDAQDWKPVSPSGMANSMYKFACSRE